MKVEAFSLRKRGPDVVRKHPQVGDRYYVEGLVDVVGVELGPAGEAHVKLAFDWERTRDFIPTTNADRAMDALAKVIFRRAA